MIDDLDEAMRRLLVREMPIKNAEVNIEFDQPKREWSARLSKPTLNLFLHDVRENTTLRQQEWEIERNGKNTATKRRTPIRLDLHYMITAWATEPDDEHRLITRTMMALFRFATLPDDVLPESLQSQPGPIPIRMAQSEELPKPTDLWGVLDNELRPAIGYRVTVSLNPYQPVTGPLVRTRELRYLVQRDQEPEQVFMVGGEVRGSHSGSGLKLVLVDRGLDIPIASDGKFVIGDLPAGGYTLELADATGSRLKQKIRVPSPSYDLELGSDK
jgi:hypothetical protein